jgi:hypothetical protein
MEFHIVRKDKGVMQIIEGRKRPEKKDIPANQTEARQRERDEGWTPEGWTVMASFDDEDKAEKRLKELEEEEAEAKRKEKEEAEAKKSKS